MSNIESNHPPTNSRQPDPLSPTVDFSPTNLQEALKTSLPLDTRRIFDPLRHENRFGDYELLAELGRGGMGVVYKARQISLNRVVALKMILSGQHAGGVELQRFRTEIEAAARLQHNHIVNVFEVGQIDGLCYYTMEYVDGPSLAHLIKDTLLPSKTAAQYLLTVAKAMHFAHKNQVLHRDLKPGNILIDADNQPHITDFGLAKRLGGEAQQTHTGTVLGTPSYMSPEQAAGRVHELSPSSDIYGLGAVLYELLTGRPPFEGESSIDTLLQVLERDPVPPSLLNPHVDRDLEMICLKCLEKDPRARYASAEALADDLQRYLNGDTINANSFNVLDRLVRTLDRSHYIGEFHHWGNMLLIFAAIVLVEHIIICSLTATGVEAHRRWVIVSRIVQFSLLGLVFWWHRPRTLLPTSMAERQLWSTWIGYLIACTLVNVIGRELTPPGQRLNELTLYPWWSLLTGVAFFVMGSSYWGRCYAFGALFFVLAVIMPYNLMLAPLGYGILWSITFLCIGLHLRRLGKSQPGMTPSPPIALNGPDAEQHDNP
ncbi:MAG: serine/threonine protein kinase [Gemmataceae bacterium]